MNNKQVYYAVLSIMVSLAMASILTACATQVWHFEQSSPTSDADTEAGEKLSMPIARSDQPRLTPNASGTDIEALVTGNNVFAFELYQAICGGEENLLFSPFSISQALAMVYAGARGKTAEQMADTLHFTLPQERLHPAFNALDQELASRAHEPVEDASGRLKLDVAFELHVTNAVWGQKDLPYRPEYLDVLAQNYGSGMQLMDLKGNPDAAVASINRWVRQETGGRIPAIVNYLDRNTKLMLVNAIYFNAKWDLPFKEDNTYEEPFHLLDGQEKPVPMMHQMEHYKYMAGDGYQAIQLPYLNQAVAMVILLPDEGRFREIEQRLTGEWVQGVVGKLGMRNVILTMPKFTYAPTLALSQVLKGMGMADAFSQDAADFDGIIDRQVWWAWIGDVLHKSFIDVNEHKTEAAAVTIVEMFIEKGIAPSPPPPVIMKIDRPFIFLIHDVKTDTILFVGRVMNPAP